LRARETCERAGFGHQTTIQSLIAEWNYGDYEGLTRLEIEQVNPQWDLFRDGAPGGETPGQVADRADRMIKTLKLLPGPILLFSHGHFLRMLAARWLGLPSDGAKYFTLSVASMSVLGVEKEQPVIIHWNSY
jgi:probable phosphoglycerate mutase